MKKLIPAVVAAAVLAVPVVSFAQSGEALTRAQVQGQLAELERAGYSPVSNQEQYPGNLLAAEQRVSAEHGDTSGYGTVATGTSSAGGPVGGAVPAGAGVPITPIYSN